MCNNGGNGTENVASRERERERIVGEEEKMVTDGNLYSGSVIRFRDLQKSSVRL
jgi:hypothetical protein